MLIKNNKSGKNYGNKKCIININKSDNSVKAGIF